MGMRGFQKGESMLYNISSIQSFFWFSLHFQNLPNAVLSTHCCLLYFKSIVNNCTSLIHVRFSGLKELNDIDTQLTFFFYYLHRCSHIKLIAWNSIKVECPKVPNVLAVVWMVLIVDLKAHVCIWRKTCSSIEINVISVKAVTINLTYDLVIFCYSWKKSLVF